MAYFNPFRPAYVDDPYPALAQLRRQEPVHRSPDLQAWVVTSYEHCLRLLRDDDAFSADPAHGSGDLGAAVRAQRAAVPLGTAPILGNSDAPDHTRMRAIVNRAFTPRAIAEMRPVVERAVGSLLDAAPAGPLEVMSALAEPLVVGVVLEHLGIPEPDRERVRGWSQAIMRARSEGPKPEVVAPAAKARDELLRYLEEAPRVPRTTVMDTVRDAAAGGEALTSEEMAMLLIHISLAGNGPSAYALGNAVLALGTHPDQLGELAASPTLASQAVEEALRFDSPTHIVTRVAIVETMLGPRKIRPGDLLYAVLGAANRDPAQFPDADEFDVGRKENRHLSFGMGMHFCLGAPLARLELEAALCALVDRYGVFQVRQMQRGGTFLLRGPQALVIEAAG